MRGMKWEIAPLRSGMAVRGLIQKIGSTKLTQKAEPTAYSLGDIFAHIISLLILLCPHPLNPKSTSI